MVEDPGSCDETEDSGDGLGATLPTEKEGVCGCSEAPISGAAGLLFGLALLRRRR